MTTSRETFVVQVHPDGGAVVEHVRTGECVWLGLLSEVPNQIQSWLGGDGRRNRAVLVQPDDPTGGTNDR
jgi:hypothetical protein